MPKRRPLLSVEAGALESLRRRGVVSDVLDARLAYADLEGVRRDVADLEHRARVFPRMLPTASADGRWSTSEPSLSIWHRQDAWADGLEHNPATRHAGMVRDVFLPDPGTYWLGFDWQDVEARLVATYCQDRDDLEAFRTGANVHAQTACLLFGIDPPVTDTQRHAAKFVRDALVYAAD